MDKSAVESHYAILCQVLSERPAIWLAEVDPLSWLQVAQTVRAEQGRLIALWGRYDNAYLLSCVYVVQAGLLCLRLRTQDSYPDLSELFPCANRMQRALHDMLGVRAAHASDQRPWLNHGKWSADYFPLRGAPDAQTVSESAAPDLHDYPFVSVRGEGVHEIAVGPIHAGIIEPGHFRFSVVGEKVLRLEQRFGYKHKGVEKLFRQYKLDQGQRLAGRISGDTTVAYSWAYCMAAEMLCDCQIPSRAAWLRALLLERERVANHLGDLGALGNDVGLAFGLAQFSTVKEEWLRLNAELFSHRLLMDTVIPGGVSHDLEIDGIQRMLQQCLAVETRVHALQHFYEEHAGLQDRFIGSGKVSRELATQLGLCGFAARASGLAHDARLDQPSAPYDAFPPHICVQHNGDVAARAQIRFAEIFVSLHLQRELLNSLPEGACLRPLPAHDEKKIGLGWIEAWRGPVLVALECAADGQITSCHCHDPSWQNWPVLEHAIMGNIVPDFPLINKSFNLSYSGVDL